MENSPKLTLEERLLWRKRTCGIILLAWVLAAFKNGFLENGLRGYFLDPFWAALAEMVVISMIAAFPAYLIWQPFRKTSPFAPIWAAVLALWFACRLSVSIFQ